MALRIRLDGKVLCAALHPPMLNDIYINDEQHYELSANKKVLVTESHDKHKVRGEWWWAGFVPRDVEIDTFYMKETSNDPN